MIENVGKCLEMYIEEPDIVWRCCLCLYIVGLFSSDICKEVISLEVHELLANHYEKFAKEPRLQQQVLWLYNSMLAFPAGRRKMHESATCIKLFLNLLEKRELETSNLKHVAKAVSIFVCMFFCSLITVTVIRKYCCCFII